MNFGATANPATLTGDLFVIESGICDYDFVNLTLSSSQQAGIRVTGNGSKLRVCNLWINQWNIQGGGQPRNLRRRRRARGRCPGQVFTGNGDPVLQEVGNAVGAVGEWVPYTPSLAAGSGTFA